MPGRRDLNIRDDILSLDFPRLKIAYLLRQCISVNFTLRRQNHRTFDRVLQLANVTRPRVLS